MSSVSSRADSLFRLDKASASFTTLDTEDEHGGAGIEALFPTEGKNLFSSTFIPAASVLCPVRNESHSLSPCSATTDINNRPASRKTLSRMRWDRAESI